MVIQCANSVLRWPYSILVWTESILVGHSV